MGYEDVKQEIVYFIRDKVHSSGAAGACLGLSGGLDSAVVAYLAIDAIGNERVYCRIMPYHENGTTSDAIKLAEILKINYEVNNIRDIVESFERVGNFKEELTKQNLMARTRKY